MGKIDFNETGCLGRSENTANEYDNEISFELLRYKLDRIVEAVNDSNGYVCYVMGMGTQPKNIYHKLKQIVGVKVVWFGSVLPKYARVFSSLIASYAGILKIVDANKIPDVFLALVEQSMAGVYVFPEAYECKFVELVKSNPLPKDFSFGIKDSKDYFFYIVDADNYESETGIYEIVSYGIETRLINMNGGNIF